MTTQRKRETQVDYAVRLYRLGEQQERKHADRYDKRLGDLLATFDQEAMREYMERTGGKEPR